MKIRENTQEEPPGAEQDPNVAPSRSTRVWQRLAGDLTGDLTRGVTSVWAQFLASLTFYTCLPIPQRWVVFYRVARFAPWVGLLLGGLLAGVDGALAWLGMPLVTRTAGVVVIWVAVTGGLHLDGAIDAADGLAVGDPRRRLRVMAESTTGAFGVMAAVCLLLLKFAALMGLTTGWERGIALMAAAGWGRWGQVLAIARYPYLKPQGKGAFHKQEFRSPWDLWLGMVGLLGFAAGAYWAVPYHGLLIVGLTWGGMAIAFLVAAWFQQKLGGHTGDTYGAVVEWTEALLLCLATVL